MVHHLSRPILAAAIAAWFWWGSAQAASHRHSHKRHHTAETVAAASSPHRATGCAAPLTASQHDPSVRDVVLQRSPDGGGVVTMCLVSRQAALINPSASIGIFGQDGILAGTAAQAMPGKFEPTADAAGEVNVVKFTLQVPADPPLPSRLEPTAMIQLAWDSCPDDACAKPAEQSLALLQPIRLSGGPDSAPSAAPPSDTAPRAVVTAAAPGEKHAKAHHRKHHSTASIASGTIY